MKHCRLALFLVVAGLVASCARTPEVTLNLSVKTQDAAVLEEARRILLYRFGEFPASIFSSIETTSDGSVISFRFKGGAPEGSILTYLYETRGRVRASLAKSSAILFTDRDIEEASLAYVDGMTVVRLRLSQAAGEHVFALTTRSFGKIARVTLDGRPLLEATINGAFRDSFQMTLPDQDIEKAQALCAVLRSGALPAPVSLVQREQGI
jgi:hypothetical protein